MIPTAAEERAAEESLPPRGAWIEMPDARLQRPEYLGRSPRGERGLKYVLTVAINVAFGGRSPRGERGLKCKEHPEYFDPSGTSLPPRGAWIEIFCIVAMTIHKLPSLPPRGAWIEIQTNGTHLVPEEVAPPAGSVD